MGIVLLVIALVSLPNTFGSPKWAYKMKKTTTTTTTTKKPYWKEKTTTTPSWEEKTTTKTTPSWEKTTTTTPGWEEETTEPSWKENYKKSYHKKKKAKKSPYWEDSKEDSTPSCDNDCKGGGVYDVCAIDVEDGKYEILRYKNPCRAKCAGETKVFRPCPLKCTCNLDPNPVCGKNGKTYHNKCLAKCDHADIECDKRCPCKKSYKKKGASWSSNWKKMKNPYDSNEGW